MKKILVEKGLAFFIVFIAFLVTGYLYSQGKISFLAKDKKVSMQNVVAELLYTGKDYSLNYAGRQDSFLLICSFEENENWSGDGTFDFTDPIGGESALVLGSQNNYRATAKMKLASPFLFSAYQSYKIFINLRSDPQNLENIDLSLVDSAGSHYRYPLRGLAQGWNLVDMASDRFSLVDTNNIESAPDTADSPNTAVPEITEVELVLVSRPRGAVSVSFDTLWAEKDNRYLADWNTRSENNLGWLSGVDSFGTMLYNGTAVVKEIASAKDYVAITRVTPLYRGSFGVVNRGNYKNDAGYYFVLDGIDTSSWRVYRYGNFQDNGNENTVLAKGDIANIKIERNKPYWFKADLAGRRLAFYLSLDGVTFSKIVEVTDPAIASGGIGVVSNTISLVDYFKFSQ